MSFTDCIHLSEIAGILPTKKSDEAESEKEDDPSSPYSVNYSGEYNKNKVPGYSLVLADKNGKQTGYLHFTSPGSSTKLSWPRTDKGSVS